MLDIVKVGRLCWRERDEDVPWFAMRRGAAWCGVVARGPCTYLGRYLAAQIKTFRAKSSVLDLCHIGVW